MTDFTKDNLLPVDIELKPGQRLMEVQEGVWIPVGIGGNFAPLSPGETPSSGGAFDLVKVTEYSPYAPAYPPQKGYDISFGMHLLGDESTTVDTAAYTGRFTVTDETKANTSYGRVYKNAGGYYLYAYDTLAYEQATDSTNSDYATWCIGSTLGEYYYGAVAYTLNSDPLSGSWTSEMNGIKDFTIAEVTTSEATEAIPMVLKGAKCTAYDVDTKAWTIEYSVQDLIGFEESPKRNNIYVATSDSLIRNSIGYHNNELPYNGLIYYQPFNGIETPEVGSVTEKRGYPSYGETSNGIKYAVFDGKTQYKTTLGEFEQFTVSTNILCTEWQTASGWAYWPVSFNSGAPGINIPTNGTNIGGLPINTAGNTFDNPELNKWYNLVLVGYLLNESLTFKFYVNGVKIGEGASNPGNNETPVKFGVGCYWNYSESGAFKGQMFDTAVWNRHLTDAEITSVASKALSL